ncbi:Fic family protein [Rhodococcus opacus]|uniref:Fic family protein n=1 Tax=Rhodococcus opacus TaxID=37919 RepID=UPI0024125AAB|nr:Fic family protein [Rhodococcus opacus]
MIGRRNRSRSRWRQQQVWIGGGSLGPHTAHFVPPHHDRVPELIDDLIVFANRVDVTVIAQIAVAHAQFETIHPFLDGNGRVGRALIQAMLRGGSSPAALPFRCPRASYTTPQSMRFEPTGAPV